jgi:hypothetical protein
LRKHNKRWARVHMRERDTKRREEAKERETGQEGIEKPAAREFFLFSVFILFVWCALRQRRFRRQNIVKCPGSRR